jgi:acetyl-CoA carboxylase carboxyl transferase subunit alpha
MTDVTETTGTTEMADGPGPVPLTKAPVPPVVTAEAAEAAWRRVQLARHPDRPRTLSLVAQIFDEFVELHGDRTFRDDPAIVGGPARLDGRAVMVIGHQKGSDTESNILRNFGSPMPEGFRKAERLMRLADRIGVPLLTFLDTAGAFPGPAAEERGQAEAIASSIRLMTGLRVPIVVVIVGEGGSGGALAIGVGDEVLALENAVYSVISPEGCAAILWRSAEAAPLAAAAMRMTAAEQKELGIVDGVIDEPVDGAHTDLAGTAAAIKHAVIGALARLDRLDPDDLQSRRYERLRAIGTFEEVEAAALRVGGPSLGARLGRLLGLPGTATPSGATDDELDEEGGA